MSNDKSEDAEAKMTKAELAERIGEQFRINQNRSDVFDEVAGELLGLNHTDQRCLDIISRLGQVTAGELAREAGLTTGGVTAVVDRLVRDGYARRVRDEEDRRRVLIEASPEAFERIWRIWGPLQEEWEARSRRWSREQLEFLLRFLEQASAIAEQHIERIRAMRDEAQSARASGPAPAADVRSRPAPQ